MGLSKGRSAVLRRAIKRRESVLRAKYEVLLEKLKRDAPQEYARVVCIDETTQAGQQEIEELAREYGLE